MISVLSASLLVGAAVAAQQTSGSAIPGALRTPSQMQSKTASVHELRGYSVVLVVGDMQASSGAGGVPSAARKALTDMQAFLPYKRYQLLDAAWMTCCATARSSIVGRLRGPDDREYTYSIESLGVESSRLTVRFILRDGDVAAAASGAMAGSGAAAGARGGSASGGGGSVGGQLAAVSEAARAEYSRQLYEARKEREEAEIQLRKTKQRHDVGVSTDTDLESATARARLANNRVEELERTLGSRNTASATAASRGNLLDSTFAIAIDETVVIGTSRLKGDQALIALLTAAGKQHPAR